MSLGTINMGLTGSRSEGQYLVMNILTLSLGTIDLGPAGRHSEGQYLLLWF